MSPPIEITETVKINGDEHLAVQALRLHQETTSYSKNPLMLSQFVSIDMFKDKGFYYFKPRILSLLNNE